MDDDHRDDVFKEYSVWKAPGKQTGLRRSLRCVPQAGGAGGPGGAGGQKRLPRFPDQPEPPLDLANIVPASPLPSHNGSGLMISRGLQGHHRQFSTLPQSGPVRHNSSQEHDLIATYARRLAASSPDDDLNINVRTQKGPRREQSGDRKEDKNLRLVQELELKNAEIMKEIARLRQNRATEIERASQNPGPVSSELENLRTRKMELELRLSELQQTRKDLMIELEELMKVLKVQGTSSNQASKFTKISRNQTASTKLRPFGGLVGSQHDSLLYVRSPEDVNNSSTDSVPASSSMPASVNSLSE